MRFIHYTNPRHSYSHSFQSLFALFSYDLLRPTELSQTLFDFKHFIWSNCQVSALSSSLRVFQEACIFFHTSSLLTTSFWSHYLTPLNITSACRLSPPTFAWVIVLFLSSPPYSRVSHPCTLFLLAEATSSQTVIPFPLSLSPSLPRSFPCDKWGCLLGAVHIYWVGERTLSVSLTLHISIPVLNRHPEPKVWT